jgi:hypothetical protein
MPALLDFPSAAAVPLTTLHALRDELHWPTWCEHQPETLQFVVFLGSCFVNSIRRLGGIRSRADSNGLSARNSRDGAIRGSDFSTHLCF